MSSQLGELTDQGRQSTYVLGTRLRNLYISQLGFMPSLISNADLIYLRATPLPRALESVQQTFWGMYPLTSRTAAFPPPTIVTRTPADETLFPNDGNCRRFAQLSRAFAQRTADRWNDSEDMKHLTAKIGKWMPGDGKVAVDSHPRLSGVMDTVNATLAHGPETMLPKEFYDPKSRAIIDRLAVEEWFSGYQENREYRTLGIGALVGDITERMVSKIEGAGLSINEIGGENGKLGRGRGGETGIRFALSGCHDTTLAGILTGLGAFKGENWPPYTSHIAFELFREKDVSKPAAEQHSSDATISPPAIPPPSSQQKPGLFSSFLGLRSPVPPSTPSTPNISTSHPPPIPPADQISRKPYTTLTPTQKSRLEKYYVRIRYNDKVMKIPACSQPGNHFEGDESLCTFETFKRVVDGFTPKDWKGECGMNLVPRDGTVTGPGLTGPSQEAGGIEAGS
jgi:acid phosphatase